MTELEQNFYNSISVLYVKYEFIFSEMKIVGICRYVRILRDHKNYYCITSQ